MIRQSSLFNLKKKNIKLCDYDFFSEKILNSEDVAKDSNLSLLIFSLGKFRINITARF